MFFSIFRIFYNLQDWISGFIKTFKLESQNESSLKLLILPHMVSKEHQFVVMC